MLHFPAAFSKNSSASPTLLLALGLCVGSADTLFLFASPLPDSCFPPSSSQKPWIWMSCHCPTTVAVTASPQVAPLAHGCSFKTTITLICGDLNIFANDPFKILLSHFSKDLSLDTMSVPYSTVIAYSSNIVSITSMSSMPVPTTSSFHFHPLPFPTPSPTILWSNSSFVRLPFHCASSLCCLQCPA